VFKDQKLDKLAQSFMQMIEEEKDRNKVLTRLMAALQGDDVMYQHLNFRTSTHSQKHMTREYIAERSEGGSGFGVSNIGLQLGDNKGKKATESEDEGLETLRDVREKLLVRIHPFMMLVSSSIYVDKFIPFFKESTEI
jgi:hypothetical protein